MNDRNDKHGDDAGFQDAFELTPEEKKAMEALPRHRVPDAALEDRVVAALRARGRLRPPRRPVIELTAWRVATAAAAAVVLLLCGFALGEWVGARRTAIESRLVTDIDDISTAAELQRAGSAYVQALAQFAALPDSVDGAQAIQGREVALATLYTAADQAARLVPKDELARQLLVAIGAERGTRTSGTGGGAVFDGTTVIAF